ncbi:DNA/RNA non-specific endonuclease [Roseomonas sp. SSH11]|uniref:Endonuclease n=1 Tax=Pararoseomonas baculiformis TaxID=2820812 RepID=A0ABS4ADY9_9PROT|nr:DNA/RNA non-specific endonuclease [Pararoseomonas baculiformis]
MAAAAVALAAASLALPPVPAGAQDSNCRPHHPGGVPPAITRPQLAAQTRTLCYEAFAVIHSGISRTPLAAAERLTRASIQRARQVERDDRFHAEDALPEDERSRLSDYARSGYDRGHMAPSGNMPTPSAQAESFSLANIVPQNPGMNRCLWEGVESTVRELAMEEGEVFVVTGPVFEGGNLLRLNGRVLVPTSLYKAVYLPRRGQAAAYLAPNEPGLAWRAVSLDELRDIAGIDVFPQLSPAVKARAMALPEPRPSNVRGSCDNLPDAAPAPRPQPPAGPDDGDGVSTTLILAGIFAAVMVAALLRVLGRR